MCRHPGRWVVLHGILFGLLFALGSLLVQCGEVTGVCEDVVCDDDNACTEDACDPVDGACVFTALDDGTACTVDAEAGLCLQGACIAWCDGVECDDGNDCTEDLCDRGTGECTHPHRPDGAECDFGELPGVCESGVCVDAELCREVDCSDGNDCTDDVCDLVDASCSNPNRVDGAACEVDELPGECAEGVCIGLCEGVDCEDDNPCTMDGCDPVTGTCPHTPVKDGTECDFDDLTGICEAGQCVKKRSWGVPEFLPEGRFEEADFDASGRAFVVWVQEHTYLCEQPSDIWADELLCARTSRFVPGFGWEASSELGCDVPGCVYRVGSSLRGVDVAADPVGNAFGTWTEASYLDTTITVRRFTPSGGWGETQTALGLDAHYPWKARIAADGGGNAIVVYGSPSDIIANRYAVGSGWGAPEHIGDGGGLAYIAVGANGHGLAYWRSLADVFVAAPYTVDDGWREAKAIPGAGGSLPKIVIDPHGHAIAMWSSGVWSNEYTPDAGWGAPQLVHEDGRFEDVAINASGAAVAVWVQSDETTASIWSARYTPGIGWGSAERVSAGFWGEGWPRSTVDIDDQGNAIAMWTQAESYDLTNLWWNRYMPSSGWGEPELLTEDVGRFALGVDPDGDATVVWASVSGRPGTWANRYE
jgi:hypothetical protein